MDKRFQELCQKREIWLYDKMVKTIKIKQLKNKMLAFIPNLLIQNKISSTLERVFLLKNNKLLKY
jgi:hypothetical protein